MNAQITDFVRKVGELAFQMYIADPPLVFDLKRIGERVLFNQFKFESVDGFIKAQDECLIIFPPVMKITAAASGQPAVVGGEMAIKANVLPVNYEF